MTLTVKVLPGASGTCIRTVPPSSTSPSMLVKVEFHCVIRSTRVKIVQIFSGGAWMSVETAYCSRKVDCVCAEVMPSVGIAA